VEQEKKYSILSYATIMDKAALALPAMDRVITLINRPLDRGADRDRACQALAAKITNSGAELLICESAESF